MRNDNKIKIAGRPISEFQSVKLNGLELNEKRAQNTRTRFSEGQSEAHLPGRALSAFEVARLYKKARSKSS